VFLQRLQFMKEDPGALVKRASGLGQADAIAAAVEQAQSQLLFEIFDRERDRRLGSPQRLGGA